MGIDIGGSGIKGAPVDLDTGTLAEDRYRIPTPQPAKPELVGDVVADIAKNFKWKGPIGVTFPAVMKEGVAYSAANVDDDWIGTSARLIFERKTGCEVLVLNDADAAGLAEMTFGAGRGRMGTVFVLTFGTGIGSSMFIDGKVVPNTELGHLYRKNKKRDYEHYAADSARERKGLSWKKWAKRVNDYLNHLEFLFSPDLFIIGGGVSKKYDKFLPLLDTQAQVVPAQLRNNAGIVGAAMAARDLAG